MTLVADSRSRETNPVKQTGLRGRPWTSKEIATLRQVAPGGAEAAALLLGRSVTSVRMAAARHRISLRRPGERRGLVLGQPRDQSWTELRGAADLAAAARTVRDAILAGESDPARLERTARRALLLAAGAPLCPACARNPQERATTGLCDECHLRELARAHREDQSRQAAQRELWRERQRKTREKKRGAADG